MSDTPEWLKHTIALNAERPSFREESHKLKPRDIVALKADLETAEKAREFYRRSENWSGYAGMCEETARLGRLIGLEEQEKRNEK